MTAVVRTHPMQARCRRFLLALSEAVGMVAGSPAAGCGLRGGGGGCGGVVAAGGQSFAPCEGQHVVSVYHCDTGGEQYTLSLFIGICTGDIIYVQL